MDCVFLDFSKAFHKVSHKQHIFKLGNLNLEPKVLIWIKAFFTNRLQFVRVNGSNSSFTQIDSGVSQGFVLGSILTDLH